MGRPSRALARHLAAALSRALVGQRLDKLWRPGERQLLFKARGLDGRVLIDLEHGHPRVVVTSDWPDTPAAPDRQTLILRNHLENRRVTRVEATDRSLVWGFVGPDGDLTLTVQLAGRYPNAALFSADGAEIVRLIDRIPAHDPDSPPLPDGPDPYSGLEDADLFAAYDTRTRGDAERRALDRRAAGLRRAARTEERRLDRTISALERDLAKAEAAERDRHHGELLKTVIGRVPRGATEVAISDWERGGEPTVVALSPELDVVANMERCFKRYRKYANAQAGIEQRLLEAMTTRDQITAIIARCDALDSGFDGPPENRAVGLDGVERDLHTIAQPRAKQAPPGRKDAAPALPYRRFVSRDGVEILVGKGARDNDRLTFQVARGHDVWLHARDVAGSHVVIRAGGAAPSSETLIDAALLAAWNSKARGDAVIDVMWTERKHVRKAKGGAPGLVTTSATKNLAVREDPERLARLYSSSQPS